MIVHGGGPDITALPTASASRCGSSGAARHRRAHHGAREDGAGRQDQQGDRARSCTCGRARGGPGRRRRRADSAARPSSPDGTDLGFVGRVDGVDTGVAGARRGDYVPVVASVGVDARGQSYNINADRSPARSRRALGARKAIFLTDVEGIFRTSNDPEQPDQRVPPRRPARADGLRGDVSGGMIPKLARRASTRSRRGDGGAHHGRPCAALGADRDLHRDGIGTKVTRRMSDPDDTVSSVQRGRPRPCMIDLRAPAVGVRARRGRVASGTRRASSTSTAWPASR